MMRASGLIRSVSFLYCRYGEDRDWPGRGERHLRDHKAAAHRHSLDRPNTVNVSLKKIIYGA